MCMCGDICSLPVDDWKSICLLGKHDFILRINNRPHPKWLLPRQLNIWYRVGNACRNSTVIVWILSRDPA